MADKATRQLEAAFNVPASRVKWGLRLLTPLPPAEHVEDEDEEAALPPTPKPGVGRTDMFRVKDRGNVFARRTNYPTSKAAVLRAVQEESTAFLPGFEPAATHCQGERGVFALDFR